MNDVLMMKLYVMFDLFCLWWWWLWYWDLLSKVRVFFRRARTWLRLWFVGYFLFLVWCICIFWFKFVCLVYFLVLVWWVWWIWSFMYLFCCVIMLDERRVRFFSRFRRIIRTSGYFFCKYLMIWLFVFLDVCKYCLESIYVCYFVVLYCKVIVWLFCF